MNRVIVAFLLSVASLSSVQAWAGQDSVQLYQKERFIEAKRAAAQEQAKLEACAREHMALMKGTQSNAQLR